MSERMMADALARYEIAAKQYEAAYAAWERGGRVGPRPPRPVKPHTPGWPVPADPRPAAVSAPAGEATEDRAKAARCPACGVACFVDVGGALCDYHTALFHACAIQEDIAAILRALGLSDHARPVSAHAVVHDEILPAVAALRQGSHA